MFATEQIANITDTEVFDTKMGLKIAVAFVGLEYNPEPILDKSFGRIVFTKWTWGISADGTYYETFDEIPSHVCTKHELGLEDSTETEENMFFPAA